MLICLAVGYLLGAMSAEPDAGRTSRASSAPGVPDRGPPPPPLAAPIGEAAPAPDAAPPGVAVATPDPSSTTEDPDDEQGTLVVDFTGFDGPGWARLEATDMHGNLDYAEQEARDDRLASFGLYPGEVLVRWEDRGAMRRFAARARVEAGRVTRVLAADPRHVPLPDPPGFAVLDVRIAGTDGGWLADVDVSVAGRVLGGLYSIDVLTDPEGWARFRVRAGTYEVEVGDLLTFVSLQPGERRVLELRHEAHGEVAVDPTLEGIYALRPEGEHGAPGRVVSGDQKAVRFVFVPPGSYDLCYTFASGEYFGHWPDAQPETRVLANVEVRAGRAERFAHHPEPGFLEVSVDAAAAPAGRRWQMRVSSQGDATAALLHALEADGDALRGRTGPMAKGHYKVEILADGRVLSEQSVVVGYGPTRLETKLPR